MGKSEALIGACRNTGVFPSSLQLLPAVNAGVCTSDMPIYPTGTYHPSLLLPSIRLLHPDHGRPERTVCQPQDWVWPLEHQHVGTAGSVEGVRRSWEVFWLCSGLSKRSSFCLGVGAVPDHIGDAVTSLLLLLAGGVSCFLWLRQRLLFFFPHSHGTRLLAYDFSYQ